MVPLNRHVQSDITYIDIRLNASCNRDLMKPKYDVVSYISSELTEPIKIYCYYYFLRRPNMKCL